VSHVAAYKIGCIAIPLFTQFGPEAIKFRLNNSETSFRILITDAEDLQKVAELSLELPNLETIVVTDYNATGLKRQAIETYVGRITDDV
jgi:acetyl-CoA synthetase